ncbi:MAG: hypothetical protein RIB61_19795, partial [Roseicyclus sp.]
VSMSSSNQKPEARKAKCAHHAVRRPPDKTFRPLLAVRAGECKTEDLRRDRNGDRLRDQHGPKTGKRNRIRLRAERSERPVGPANTRR